MAIHAGAIAGLSAAGASNATRVTPAAIGLRAKGLGGNVPGYGRGRQGTMNWGDFKPLVENAKRAATSRLGSLALGYAAHEGYSEAKTQARKQRRKNR